jgi:hypothetical protein
MTRSFLLVGDYQSLLIIDPNQETYVWFFTINDETMLQLSSKQTGEFVIVRNTRNQNGQVTSVTHLSRSRPTCLPMITQRFWEEDVLTPDERTALLDNQQRVQAEQDLCKFLPPRAWAKLTWYCGALRELSLGAKLR